jgi:hypothetical protein
MTKAKETKRENYDVNPQQQAELETLRELIEAPSKKDAMLFAVHLALHLAAEAKKGYQLFVGDAAKHDLRRLVVLGMEKPNISGWVYLVEHAHPWKKQLFVKGRKLPAAAVWTAMIANKLSVKEAADNWDLPEDAIREIIDYCDANKALLEMEAAEELRRLEEKGIGVGAKAALR